MMASIRESYNYSNLESKVHTIKSEEVKASDGTT